MKNRNWTWLEWLLVAALAVAIVGGVWKHHRDQERRAAKQAEIEVLKNLDVPRW